MTAATTIPGGHPQRLHTVGVRAAFALAGAAIGSLLTFAATDDDSLSPRVVPAAVEATTGNAVSVSADAADRRSTYADGRSTTPSADAAERRAEANVEALERMCAASTVSVDAIERCISSG